MKMKTPDTSSQRFCRFFKYVTVSDGCWNWTGTKSPKGYGLFFIGKGKRLPAHRYIYDAVVGGLTRNLAVDHLCRNRLCVRLDHLEAVTFTENVMRGMGACAVNARKTVGNCGHELKKLPNGWRYCAVCGREKKRNYARAKAAAKRAAAFAQPPHEPIAN